MSLETYDYLLDSCDQTSEEYATLKNGLIVRRPEEDHYVRIVEIACEQDAAVRLLTFVQRVSPDAAREIVTSIDIPRS